MLNFLLGIVFGIITIYTIAGIVVKYQRKKKLKEINQWINFMRNKIQTSDLDHNGCWYKSVVIKDKPLKKVKKKVVKKKIVKK